MAVLRYEERVRIERANGLRKPDDCGEPTGRCVQSDDFYAGCTYDDVAHSPLKQNAVCPDAKVIVPIRPAFLVEEEVPVRKVSIKPAPYRVVDFNPCDGKDSVLNTIPHGMDTEVIQAHSTTEHTVKNIDTFWDTPTTVKTVKKGVVNDAVVKQPLAYKPDSAITDITENGKEAVTVVAKPKKAKQEAPKE